LPVNYELSFRHVSCNQEMFLSDTVSETLVNGMVVECDPICNMMYS